MEKLAVCIPCFNAEEYIGQAIESVLSQSYREFVLYVVDDCSSDGTLDVVKRFRDKRVVVQWNRANLGLFENEQRSLELADSPYVKILSADDVLAPGCLEREVAILDQYSRVVLVFGASDVIDSRGRVILGRRFAQGNRVIQGEALIRTILTSGRNPIGEPSGVMLRKRVIKEQRLGFDVRRFRHMADLDLWVQVLEHGEGYYLDEKLFSFRLHRSAGTVQLLRRSIAEHLKLLEKYGDRHPLSKLERLGFSLRLGVNFFAKIAVMNLFAR